MKTTFEFSGKGYLWLSAGGQKATLSDGAEIEAVHSENEQKEKEKLTPAQIALCILIFPIVMALVILTTAFTMLSNHGLATEKFFEENNPFKTRKKFTLAKAGETVKITVKNPVFALKQLEYTALPQVTAEGETGESEAEYSYEQKQTRTGYVIDAYSQCAVISFLTVVLAAFGVRFILELPPFAKDPFSFIVGLLASLLLIATLAIAVWAIVRTERYTEKQKVKF